jgi:hypothetical protein
MSFFLKETDRLHQSTDSLADSSSKGMNEFQSKRNYKLHFML